MTSVALGWLGCARTTRVRFLGVDSPTTAFYTARGRLVDRSIEDLDAQILRYALRG
jgi:hypothetical protein